MKIELDFITDYGNYGINFFVNGEDTFVSIMDLREFDDMIDTYLNDTFFYQQELTELATSYYWEVMHND